MRFLFVALACLTLWSAPAAVAGAATVELEQPCPAGVVRTPVNNMRACYDPDADVIYHDGSRTFLWHERGHVFDHKHLTDSDREWLSDRYFEGRPWRAADVTDGYPAAEELFASGYGACHLPRAKRGNFGPYGYAAWTRAHRRLCNTITILELIR
jgi:hypothetical protein